MKIFLIGLPGSGKTTLGKSLAEKLKLRFIDLDREIEKIDGQSIQEIFDKKKEPQFRELESKVLKSFCASDEDYVMAAGGGTPCFFDNLETMNRSGQTVFIDTPAKEIASRLMKTNLLERPLFARLDPDQLKDKIEFLRSQRISYYRQAQFIFSGVDISSGEIANRIKE